MRSLTVGSTGLIGSHVLAAASRYGLAAGTGLSRRADYRVDLTHGPDIHDAVADFRPGVIFAAADAGPNAAAHADGVARLAQAARAVGSLVVYFSSGDVFADSTTAALEDDPIDPGHRHARAEDALRMIVPEHHLIIRAHGVFGGNWLRNTVDRLEAGLPVRLDNIAATQPTYAPDLAAAVASLAAVGEVGTIHLVGPERRTRFTLARSAAHALGLDASLIHEGGEPARGAWLARGKSTSILGRSWAGPPAAALKHWAGRRVRAQQPLLSRAA